MHMLMEVITRPSQWVLRMNVCAHLVEQLRMLEIYGGCSTNIQELFVPTSVYKGLDKMLDTRVRLGDVSGPATHEPLASYVRAPSNWPESDRVISEKDRKKLNEGEGGDKPVRLAHLARRMLNRHQKRAERAGEHGKKAPAVTTEPAAGSSRDACPPADSQ
eukprot:GHVU01235229.1.p1 GENE.GHVU01235229.1~~GHVU01235229.1.p1  ORF type:complete len:161 (+),score=20.07 GHVU01235229.1:1-483(+)